MRGCSLGDPRVVFRGSRQWSFDGERQRTRNRVSTSSSKGIGDERFDCCDPSVVAGGAPRRGLRRAAAPDGVCERHGGHRRGQRRRGDDRSRRHGHERRGRHQRLCRDVRSRRHDGSRRIDRSGGARRREWSVRLGRSGRQPRRHLGRIDRGLERNRHRGLDRNRHRGYGRNRNERRRHHDQRNVRAEGEGDHVHPLRPFEHARSGHEALQPDDVLLLDAGWALELQGQLRAREGADGARGHDDAGRAGNGDPSFGAGRARRREATLRSSRSGTARDR